MAYITTAEAKDYVGGITSSSDDALITAIIESTEVFVESYTGRDFKADSDSTRTFDANDDVYGGTLYFDEDLAASPTTVKTNADASAGGTTLTENTDFVVVPKNRTPYYALKLLGSSSETWTYTDDSELGITVLGPWGFSTTPPLDIVLAMKDIVKTVYRSRDSNVEAGNVILSSGMVITPAQIPKMTLETLSRYRKLV